MNEHAKKINEDIFRGMPDHAKKVCKAWWMEGKQLQRWSPSFKLEDEDGNEVEVEGQDVGRLFWCWRDANPIDYKPKNRPDSEPDLWRVKPKRKPIRLDFKVGLIRHEDDPNAFFFMASKPDSFDCVESSKNFVKWATDLLSTDVVVEVKE